MIPLFWGAIAAVCVAIGSRRAVALVLVVSIVVTLAPPAMAQIGIPGVIAAATAVVSLIDNDIAGLLHFVQGAINSINSVLAQFNLFWSGVIYPPP